MNKRLLLNVVMVLGVGLLTWVAVNKPGQTPAPETSALTTLDAAQVKHLIITRSDAAVELQRRDDSWWLLGEPDIPADPVQMENLLRVLSVKPARSYAAVDLDLAQLELAPAAIQVRFDELVLKFGGTEPLQGLRYVEIGDRVYLIGDNYQNILQGKRAQLASRKLLPADADIVAITLPDLRLSKQDDGSWKIDPDAEMISADTAHKLVRAWSNASALWVRDYQPADGGKRVIIELADNATIEFELRQSERDVVLARPDLGLQYNIPEYSANQLFKLEQAATETPAAETPAGNTP